MTTSGSPKQELSLFDAVCLMVGIIIGVGIYQVTPLIAAGMPNANWLVGIWILGGFLTLLGVFCYAELATTYPHLGGDYVYLTRAYGPWAGFLFAWSELVILRPGFIAEMAFPFASYFSRLLGWHSEDAAQQRTTEVVLAMVAVVLLTLMNIAGARLTKNAQNFLTLAKVAGLLLIFAVAFFPPATNPGMEITPPDTKVAGEAAGEAAGETEVAAPSPTPLTPEEANEKFWSGLRLSLIMVLFTFGGWNEMAFVAAEVKDTRRNFVPALLLGTALVTVVYILVNLAFLYTLGLSGMAKSSAVAAESVATRFPQGGDRFISALICISALGAANGLIFAGSRVSYALGREYPAFSLMGVWSNQFGSPIGALAIQGAIALAILAIAGTFRDAVLFTNAAVWTFFLATSLGIFVLRWREPNTDRPYKISGHPFTTILFMLSCLFMLHNAITYKPLHATIALAIILVGVPIYFLSPPRRFPVGEANSHESTS